MISYKIQVINGSLLGHIIMSKYRKHSACLFVNRINNKSRLRIKPSQTDLSSLGFLFNFFLKRKNDVFGSIQNKFLKTIKIPFKIPFKKSSKTVRFFFRIMVWFFWARFEVFSKIKIYDFLKNGLFQKKFGENCLQKVLKSVNFYGIYFESSLFLEQFHPF